MISYPTNKILPSPTDKFVFFLQLTVITGWTISSAILCSLIFGIHQVDLHPIVAATYSSLSHTLWALCLSWTVIACATGHGGKLKGYQKMIPITELSSVVPIYNQHLCQVSVEPIYRFCDLFNFSVYLEKHQIIYYF